MISCTHRHLVFTIDDSLRHFFLEDRDLLNCLFEAVSDVIKKLFFSLNKSKNFVPGFICVLHTFGRPLEWNPHIHCLLTEGGYSDDGFWRTVKISAYARSEQEFQNALKEKFKITLKFNRGRYSYLHPERGKYITGRSLGNDFEKDALLTRFAENEKNGITEEIAPAKVSEVSKNADPNIPIYTMKAMIDLYHRFQYYFFYSSPHALCFQRKLSKAISIS